MGKFSKKGAPPQGQELEGTKGSPTLREKSQDVEFILPAQAGIPTSGIPTYVEDQGQSPQETTNSALIRAQNGNGGSQDQQTQPQVSQGVEQQETIIQNPIFISSQVQPQQANPTQDTSSQEHGNLQEFPNSVNEGLQNMQLNASAQATSSNTLAQVEVECSEQEIIDLSSTLKTYTPLLPQATQEDLLTYNQLVEQLGTLSLKGIKLPTQIGFKLAKTAFINAINTRQQQISLPQPQQQVVIQQQSIQQPITSQQGQNQTIQEKNVVDTIAPFSHLFQFQQEMNRRNQLNDMGLLKGNALVQRDTYFRDRILERSKRTIGMPYAEFIIKKNFFNRHLSKDLCQVMTQNIVPTKLVEKSQQPCEVTDNQMRLPTLNPDFQLYSTLYFVTWSNKPFEDFQGTHKESLITLNNKLPPEQRLSEPQLEAKFAFQQGSRWIHQHFDPRLNMDFNETVGFRLANGIFPQDADNTVSYARCTGLRCLIASSSDGENFYYYCETEQILRSCYANLLTNTSPVLQFGNYSCKILLQDKLLMPTLLHRLPPPQHYEALIPIMNKWAVVSKSFLVERSRTHFAPCLFLGGFFLPMMAHEKHAVFGSCIKSMPVFNSELYSYIDQNKYYRYNIQSGQWDEVPFDVVQTLPLYEEYVSPNSMQESGRIFGSSLFYTDYQRAKNMRIVTTVGSTKGDTFTGFHVTKPQVNDDEFIPKVILAHQVKRTNPQKQSAFMAFIKDQASRSAEWSIRYRLHNFYVDGPELSWTPSQNQGSLFTIPFYKDGPLGVYEVFHTHYDSIYHYFRTQRPNLNRFALIPKTLAEQYDTQQDLCTDSTNLLKRRWNQFQFANKDSWNQGSKQKKSR